MDVKDTKSYTDDGFVLNMKELVEMGVEWNKASPDGFVERINNQKLEHLATLDLHIRNDWNPKRC